MVYLSSHLLHIYEILVRPMRRELRIDAKGSTSVVYFDVNIGSNNNVNNNNSRMYEISSHSDTKDTWSDRISVFARSYQYQNQQ